MATTDQVLRKDLSRYQPLSNFVLIKRIDQVVDKTAGGMIIPEVAQQLSNTGRVVAVGEGYVLGDKLIPIPLAPGDIVLFSKYGAEDIELDGEPYLLLRYDEIKLKERLVIGLT
jgi:chaperonin GroES